MHHKCRQVRILLLLTVFLAVIAGAVAGWLDPGWTNPFVNVGLVAIALVQPFAFITRALYKRVKSPTAHAFLKRTKRDLTEGTS